MGERWFDASRPDLDAEISAAAMEHGTIAREADTAGRQWALVIYDPEVDRSAVISSGGPGAPMALDEAFRGAGEGLWGL